MRFGIEGLHMCITEHYPLQAKLLKVFHIFKLFEGKNKIRIWPKETSWRMWRSRMQRPCSHKSLSNQEQLEAKLKNAEVMMTTLNGLPGSWDSFMRGSVPEGSDYFQQNLGRRRSLNHKKRREDGSNWRSSAYDSEKIPQAMRNMRNSILEEPLIHLSIRIRYDVAMNEEDDEAERRSLRMNQIKISIQLSLFCYAFVYIQLICYAW